MKRLVLAASLMAICGAAAAQIKEGYVGDSSRFAVINPYGLCWHSSAWSPEKASAPCDTVGRPMAVYTPPPPPPAAAPAPAPLAAAPAPRPPVIEKVTLSSDVLFDFDKATLKDSGKQKLDELADRIKDANVEEIDATGHADRIASEQYNQKLSEQRAQAVKEYLATKGMPAEKIKTAGKGEAQPVTGNDCAKMGPEKGSNKKLVACLQPDRRVEIEVLGTRTAGGAPAAAGAGAGGTSSPSSGSGTTSPK
jgi:OmpA-OmpF porin, OOP family